MGNTGRAGIEPRNKRLWFAVLTPGAAWFIHLVVMYVLVPWTCAAGGQTLMLGGSALLAAVVVSAGGVSWSLWRRLKESERSNVLNNMEGNRISFMVFAGLLGSGLFLLAIILGTIPLFFVDPCSPTPSI